jgi:DHA2 family multidrug resistance protein
VKATTPTSDLWPWLVLLGLAFALTLVPTQTLALQALSGATLNKATSLVNATKLLWGTMGSAALVTVFVQQTTSHWDHLLFQLQRSVPAGGAPNLHNPSVAAAYRHLVAQAGTAGLTDVFKLAVYGAAALIVVSLAMPGRREDAQAQEEQAAPATVDRTATVA